MKKWLILTIVFILLITACTPAKKGCGDGVCDGPETAGNCPQDCGVSVRVDEEKQDSSVNTNGSDLKRSVEFTVTTETLDMGYGMTLTSLVRFDLNFPEEGGEAALPMGSVTITDYAWEDVPGCEVTIPGDLVGSSQSITYEKIEYYPDGFMIFTTPVQYEPVTFEIEMKCMNSNKVLVPEMPFYKTFGVFNEELKTLSFRPQDGFDNSMKWGTNDAFSSRIIIKVE